MLRCAVLPLLYAVCCTVSLLLCAVLVMMRFMRCVCVVLLSFRDVVFSFVFRMLICVIGGTIFVLSVADVVLLCCVIALFRIFLFCVRCAGSVLYII